MRAAVAVDAAANVPMAPAGRRGVCRWRQRVGVVAARWRHRHARASTPSRPSTGPRTGWGSTRHSAPGQRRGAHPPGDRVRL